MFVRFWAWPWIDPLRVHIFYEAMDLPLDSYLSIIIFYMRRTVVISPVLLLAMCMVASVGYVSVGQARMAGEMTSCTDRHAARQWLVGVVRALGGECQRISVSPVHWFASSNAPKSAHWTAVAWDARCVMVDSQLAFLWKHDLPPPIQA